MVVYKSHLRLQLEYPYDVNKCRSGYPVLWPMMTAARPGRSLLLHAYQYLYYLLMLVATNIVAISPERKIHYPYATTEPVVQL